MEVPRSGVRIELADGRHKPSEQHSWKDVGAWAESRDQECMRNMLRKCARQELEDAVLRMTSELQGFQRQFKA